LEVVKAAAKQVGIPERRILVLQDQDQTIQPSKSSFGECITVEALIREGLKSGETVTGQRLRDGESKTQVAFYSSSSGTTGPPKVNISTTIPDLLLNVTLKMVKISHYAFIADILLTAALNKVGEASPRYVPGDRCLGVLPFYRKCPWIFIF
jgi:4-coumarate--CoA ligase